MTGTGIMDDPYLVDNIADFRTACATTDAYVKLIADLDCNKEKYLSWNTLTSNAVEVDFNGYAIKTPYIATGKGMINGKNKTILKNGSILNIYENSASYILTKCSLYNMSVSANLYKVTNIPFSYLNSVEKCNFKIFNQNIESHDCWFSKLNSSDLTFKDTYFYLVGDVYAFSYGCLIGVEDGLAYKHPLMNGCRVEGVIGINDYSNSSKYLCYGNITNTIFAIDTSGLSKFENSKTGICTPSLNNTNIYQSDIPSYTFYSSAIACTSEQIRDPDYLNSIGFFVSEVTS